jgi:hypothetical protein
MSKVSRRSAIVTAAAAAATVAHASSSPSAIYEYVLARLDPERMSQPPAHALQSAISSALAERRGELLGVFSPQIGWKSTTSAALIRWKDGAPPRPAYAQALRAAGFTAEPDRLTPTLRPGLPDGLSAGGVYVHRWFVIASTSLPEFLELSTSGWAHFERLYDARVFGLFTAEQTPTERERGFVRLLLLTRYKDHAVWEASRDPSTEAMSAFLQRARLTRETWNASTLLLP